ncbi:MG2 domain-containing protein [Pontibacter sp. G13]|uniref:alpha-2-macroglobulin family protein n=1 Tax=Pontibacter sp. G13 TaxID=3074898 RepID=UPI00288BE4AC|nr:MG2 domain-containing protein [Pontibacter sp. G13]WNJ19010.1 MG2 domain-containing protein [Pontibacter sp. G13]
MANKKLLWYLGGALMGVVACLAIWSLSSPHPSPRLLAFNPAFKPFISAYTHGEIDRSASIKVRFASDVVDETWIGKWAENQWIDFDPQIKGNAKWSDARTLTIVPDDVLPSGQVYQASVNLDDLYTDISPDLGAFQFQFGTRLQAAEMEISSFKVREAMAPELEGVIRTVNYESAELIESEFSATASGRILEVVWNHDAANRVHTFKIPNLERADSEYEVELAWDGSKYDISGDLNRSVSVPAKHTFSHLHTYSYASPEQYMVVEFSAPIDPNQVLDGMVKLGNIPVKVSVSENQLRIFPQKALKKAVQLEVLPGIKSISGRTLEAPIKEQIAFSEVKPEVRLVGKGTIVPMGERLPLVFEAVGLKTVDVQIVKINENNIPQFLQVNRLEESRELRRVGELVLETKVDLNADPNMDLLMWNRHSLDLAPLMKLDPGAIYEVSLGYRRSYSFYECGAEEAEEDRNMLDLGPKWGQYKDPDTYSYWDGYYWGRYDERDDPCKQAYYNSERIVRRNLLASDLGLIAKRGDNGLFFAVTDIQTTEPMAGVQLEMYDFQHKLLAEVQTDSKGIAQLPPSELVPFLIVAKHQAQRGYLRLDDGSALSMSRFDTRGQSYQRGVKGFIYGERGVWRPGDEMYLTFVLEDKDRTLPEDHPVKFELKDSRGQVVHRTVSHRGTNGFYHFPVTTAADAPTGNYAASVQVGGSTFRKTLKVESIVPNRLKLELDYGVDQLSPLTANTQGELKARWLHGAIAKNLKADVKVSLTPIPTDFPRYNGYFFDDPVRKFQSEEVTLFEGRLDDQGVAQVPADIQVESEAPGKLRANFNAKVFEPGGAFSVDRFSVPYSPYNTYVGVKAPKGDAKRGMLLTDEDHQVKIVTVDPSGKPTSSSVEVTLYKVGWKWWWDQSSEHITMYNGRVNAQELDRQTVETVNGSGTFNLRVDYPDWGRYLIRAVDDQGHASGQFIYIDWPGWAGKSTDNDRGGATMLEFSADRETYSVGDAVKLSIPTGKQGRALVSIENGTKVLKSYWVDASDGMTEFSFPTTAEMAPNIYVNVTYLQPHAQTSNGLPIRLYGVLPLSVEDPTTHIQPVIAMKEEIKPMEDYQVQISEATGRPMTYTLAVVDEGLLGLTRFETPDPWKEFYKRVALDVKTWDVFDQVLGAFGAKSLLSIGGDMANEGPKSKKADRFKPVVEYLGPFELKAGERKSHKLSMPNYVGEVRVMVVAGNPDGSYGNAAKAVPVKQDLMVLGTLPRVLGPGEELQLPVTLFAMSEKVKAVNVEVKSGRKILVDGEESQIVRFYEPGEKMTTFGLNVMNSVGTDRIQITAKSGAAVSVYDVEVEIRNPNQRVTDVHASTVVAGKSWKHDLKPIGISSTNHGSIEVSSIPPINLGQRLGYLIRYPYGCVEQTTSSVFPQLYAAQLLELSDKRKKEIDGNVKAGIKRLLHFQQSDGSLAYWPGVGQSNQWGTNYAGHFLLEAKELGYSLPSGMMDKWIGYQTQTAKSWVGTERREELTQGYRLYLLAMAGKPELGAMNRMRRQKEVDPVAQWLLAGAYAQAGQKEVANKIAKKLGTTVDDYRELGGTYGSQLRDKAMILMLASEMGQRDRMMPLVNEISGSLSSDKWYSTQTTAYSLLGMATYAGLTEDAQSMEFSYRIKGGDWIKVKSDHPMWAYDMPKVSRGEVEFKNSGKTTLYPRIIVDGIPRVGDTTKSESGLKMGVTFADLAGNPIDPKELAQGTDFRLTVQVTNTGNRDYEEMVISQIFPSGWEIHNSRLDGSEQIGDLPEYQDIRDDRVYTFFDLKKGASKTFTVNLNASYLGRFYFPQIKSEAMYDHTISARQGGKWVQVVEDTAGN